MNDDVEITDMQAVVGNNRGDQPLTDNKPAGMVGVQRVNKKTKSGNLA